MTTPCTYRPSRSALAGNTRFRHGAKAIGLLIVLLLSGAVPLAHGQSNAPQLRIAVREDNQAAYLYHTALPAIGHGFNVYRKAADADTFERINLDPIRGVTSGSELRAYLGTLYDDIQRTTEQNTANGTLTKLRSDIRTANLLTFIYPEVAEALGRLYIDNDAPIGTPVTYRLEFVDGLDTPTGVVLDQTLMLLPQRPVAPTNLRAQHSGNRITLFWRYATATERGDDKVLHFQVYRIDPETNEDEQVNQKVILRNNAIFEYAFSFDVPTTGQTEQLYVRAVDISGQMSSPSEILRYPTSDTEPPNVVIDVEARPLPNKRIQVQWTASSDEDIMGYHVYRAASLSDEDGFVRLNETLLSLNETSFNDTLTTETSDAFYYSVTALDAQGNEGPLSTAAMAILDDATAPAPPSGVTASYSTDGTVTLNWESGNRPEDFKTYIVLRQRLGARASQLPSRVNPEPLQEPALTDPGEAGLGFEEGASYRYDVIALDRSGNLSTPARTTIAIPDESAPAPPTGPRALIDNASQITLFWNPTPSADVMSYVVYRRETGSTALSATPVPRHHHRFEDLDARSGHTYEYWVTAADYSGNESAPSSTVTLTMQDYTRPRHVRNVRVIARRGGETLLRWEPVPDFDLAGYRIYRSTSMTGSFEQVSDELVTDLSWTDAAGSDEAWYRVLAVDTAGNESLPSKPVRAILQE